MERLFKCRGAKSSLVAIFLELPLAVVCMFEYIDIRKLQTLRILINQKNKSEMSAADLEDTLDGS